MVAPQSFQEWGRIVVGVDESPAGRAALAYAANQAARFGAELHVVCAWSMPGGHTSHARAPGPLRDACVDEAHALLERLAADVLGPNPEVPICLAVAEPPPARALIEASEKADLVVVGSRGHSALAGALLGSVSAEVMHHARCPVTVVPPPERTCSADTREVQE